ncbi:hypothetical protein RMCBS344292_05278 [Rhizopus microsporus]|nr:hypothetical protein RMCBS344292_05278 [Rhizopus microsporus]
MYSNNRHQYINAYESQEDTEFLDSSTDVASDADDVPDPNDHHRRRAPLNKKRIATYDALTDEQKGILHRQLKSSRFNKHPPQVPPTKLAIFDFDNTLFFSPQLSPTIWSKRFLGLIAAESVWGPGWWRDERSLDLGPFEELKAKAWEGYWNETIVSKARECIANPETMTVILTGRRYHPFHKYIPIMLDSKGLVFDLIGLRPDPESTSDVHWIANDYGRKLLTYNVVPSVFESTAHFKEGFIANILHKVKSIESIELWDDRVPHVKNFKIFLKSLRQDGVIKSSKVHGVPGVKPVYNPEWEAGIVLRIINSHNYALKAKYNGARFEYRDVAENAMQIEDDTNPICFARKYLTIVPAEDSTGIRLKNESQTRLKSMFEPLFKERMEVYYQKHGRFKGQEEPVFFGKYCMLTERITRHTCCGFVGYTSRLRIDGISPPGKPWLLLKVTVPKDDPSEEHEHILPLWYKPSDENVFRKLSHHWEDIRQEYQTEIEGKITYDYKLSVQQARWDMIRKQRKKGKDRVKAVIEHTYDRGSYKMDHPHSTKNWRKDHRQNSDPYPRHHGPSNKRPYDPTNHPYPDQSSFTGRWK